MYNKYFLSTILLLSVFLLGSCATSSDDAEDIEKYIGTWNVNDHAARINYTVTISANPSNSAEILLNNFADLNATTVGLVIGNSVVIDNQYIGSNYSVSGTGSYINNGKLEFYFVLSDGIDSDMREAEFTK